MSPEQLVAILGAVTALVIALGAVVRQIAELRKDINGRLSQLVETTRVAATKEGELLGRDHMAAESTSAIARPPSSGAAA